MIKLFESKETNFKHCKWVLNECLSAYITENTEGALQLDLEYPLFDKKNLSKYVKRGNIISCPIYDSRPNQLFKIRKATKSTDNKTIIVYAEAIARADADNNYIPGLEVPAGKTRKEALQIILDNRADKRINYYIGNLDTSINKNVNLGLEDETGNVINYIDIADKSLLKAILEESTDKTNSSIYAAYKGEVIWNNFEINMVDERGKDNSFIIKSGKNLESLEEEIDDTGEDFATALIMKSSDGLFLPNQEIVYSPNADKYDGYFYKTITCDDISLEDLVTENSTDADVENAKNIVYQQLRERAQKQFDNGIDKPPTNYAVNFIQLADTEEYKEFAKLEKCELGNNVTTIYSKIGVKAEGRVISIKYNVLTDKIEEVEIGDRLKKNSDIAGMINNTSNKVEEVKKDATETKFSLKKNTKEINANIDILDGKIQLKISSDDMWSLIEQYPGKILMAVNANGEETDVTIEAGTGLKVTNGKFQIYNKNDKRVFYVGDDGYVSMESALELIDSACNAILGSQSLHFTSKNRNKDATINFDEETGDLYINCDGKVYINDEQVGGE